MPLPLTTPLGAFTNLTVAAINAALAQAGLAATTGNVFYLDPANGLDTNDGQTPATTPGGHGPVATLAAGYALLRSGYNDVLVLIGNGAASGSARITSFTWAKNAAHLVGVCAPSALSQRARIANPTTSGLTITANFFTVSGNGCLFSNLSWFQGAGAGQTGIAAAICMTVSGQRNAFVNCDFEGMGDSTSATDTGSRNLKITGGENLFSHCNIGLDTVQRTGANGSVEIASGAARTIFENCTFPFWSSDGLQYALMLAAATAADRFVLFKGCMFISGLGTAIAQLFNSVANGMNGKIILDITSGAYGVTAIGDATTKALTWVTGVASTNAGNIGKVAT
jgi:pectin methylesterase-like acyl-CoA thioesterase